MRILETEASSRGSGGAVGTLLDLRFGASTHGLCNYEELGLKRVTEADVERWRDWYFVDGNAALWFSGPRRISEWTEWTPRRASGRSYVRAGAPNAPERLVVGSDAVSLAVDAERQITVGLPDCAAVLSWEDGARTVLGASGLQVHVHPDAWVDGQRAVAAIDASVPGSMVVPMGRPAGAPASPSAPAPAAVPRNDVRSRTGLGERAITRLAWAFVGVCVLMAWAGCSPSSTLSRATRTPGWAR